LRELRQSRGLPLDAVAQKAGIAAEQLGLMESGQLRTPADLLRRLCLALSVSPSEVFSGLAQRERAPESGAEGVADEATRLLTDFSRIRDPKIRKLILSLVASYASFEGQSEL
jgi:transcriptional regulator with XRE-family HTH domain